MKHFLSICFALAFMALPAQAQKFQADSQINVSSTILTNSNTATVITTRPATFYGIDASNLNGSIAWVKLYNAATATCGASTNTPVARYMIPASFSGANTSIMIPNGDSYSNGITMCVVTGVTDGNSVAPAAGSGAVNLHWHGTQ